MYLILSSSIHCAGLPNEMKIQDPHSDLRLEGLIHDLNNVFETFSEAAELLAGDERWSTLASALQRSVARGRRITDSLYPAAASAEDLESLIETSIESVRDMLPRKAAAQLRVRRSVETGLRLPGAAEAWERVLVNLLLNAAQTGGGPGEIEVEANSQRGQVRITVADSGPGLCEKSLSRVFEPGYSTRPGGRGLGLSVVESIVRQHGGEVRAANREGRPGAVFTILLPTAALNGPAGERNPS